MPHDKPLAFALTSLVRRALATPGKAYQVDLAGGLRIAIYKDKVTLNLTLSRQGEQPPSLTELDTVFKHWPHNLYPLGERARTYLSTKW